MTQDEMKRLFLDYVEVVSRKAGNRHCALTLQNTTLEYLNKHINVTIQTSIPLSGEQIEALYDLNDFCAYQALCDAEVQRDIRKLSYVANNAMKTALMAIGLSSSLITVDRRNVEDIDLYENNIVVHPRVDGIKKIDFGRIPPARFLDFLSFDIVDDWMIFADYHGFGLKSLLDYKTNLAGLEKVHKGGGPIYEFARFQRRYKEHLNAKEAKAKESAQNAFRNSMVSSIANKYTEQKLLEGNTIEDMMLLVEDLFNDKPKKNASTKAIARRSHNNVKRIQGPKN